MKIGKTSNNSISICSDTIFKALYKDSEIGRKWINKLIRYIINVDVDNYVLHDNEINQGKGSKDSRLDLVLTNDEEKTVINIEINRSYYEALDWKNIAYLHRLAGMGLKHGEKYHRTFAVQINLNAYFRPDRMASGEYEFRMYDAEHKVYLDDETTLYSIYLRYYKDLCYNGLNEKEMMFSMLNADSFDKLREIANGNKEALGIIKELESIVKDDSIITAYEQELINQKLQRSIEAEIAEKAEADGLARGMEKGFEQGIEKGMQQGIKQGIEQGIEQGMEAQKIDTCKRLYTLGMKYEDISSVTDLTVEEIKKITKSIKK